MTNKLFPTTVVGSMPRPQYVKDLIEDLATGGRSTEGFQRLMDRTIPYVVQMQEVAGIDIVSDGEWRRKSYIGVIADICTGFTLSTRGQRPASDLAHGDRGDRSGKPGPDRERGPVCEGAHQPPGQRSAAFPLPVSGADVGPGTFAEGVPFQA